MVMPSTALNGSASSQLAVVFDGTTFSAPHNGHRELISVHREVIARAPARIDLGGGWTDVPPYCDREGGFVCNVAITLYSVATISATIENRDAGANSALIEAAVRRSGVSGLRAALRNDFPLGAGLGGSSAASAALLAGLRTWRGQPIDRGWIAEEGRRIEVEELGVAGGRQDHYAATHGGALALTFDTAVSVRRIELSKDDGGDLVRRSVLVYTGESRISGETIEAVLQGGWRGGQRARRGGDRGGRAAGVGGGRRRRRARGEPGGGGGGGGGRTDEGGHPGAGGGRAGRTGGATGRRSPAGPNGPS